MAGDIPEFGEANLIWRYKMSLVPLHVILVSLVWILHDYFITLADEIRYIWKHRSSFHRFMFLWIRYYTIFLLAFDAFQTHYFDEEEIASSNRALCVLVDPTNRIAGAICLWSIELVMQWRIYVLFNRSKKIAIFNGILFVASIFFFIYIMVVNAMIRNKDIPDPDVLRGIGCPSQITGTDWALWVPATAFEVVLFLLALYACSTTADGTEDKRPSLISVLVSENVLHFFFVASLLLFYDLMVAQVTPIPWFGYGPFHAATGIVTCRVLINLHKYSPKSMKNKGKGPERTRASLDSLPSDDSSAQEYDEETLVGDRSPSKIHDLERGLP